MVDLKAKIDFANSLAPAGNRTATATGSSVDLSNYAGAMVLVHVGTITDGTHTPSLEESADDVTYTAVAAGDLVGAFAAIASSTNQRVAYIGKQRYIRPKVTVSGATTGGMYAVTVIRSAAHKQPL